MTKPFLSPDYTPSETSAKLAFSGSRLDRLAENRDDDCIERALGDSQTRLLGFARGRLIVSFEKSANGTALFDRGGLDSFGPQFEKAVLLGYDNGAARLAVPLSINPDDEDFELEEPYKAIDFRSLALQGLLDHETLGMVAYGASLLVWHATNRFCSKCGEATEIRIGGAKRQCTSCEREHFPRTDPVVIMLIVDGERCLMGRSDRFPPGWYSALAGFVEQGETIESAVRRETFEESGIRVGDVTYHASQPWPFPHTLMIGCYGQALNTEIEMDTNELDDCRWFTRAELKDALEGNAPRDEEGNPTLSMPPKLAIANRLITDWVYGN